MSSYLFPRSTPVTMEQVYASLRRAAPTLAPDALLCLLAQIHLESDGGAKVRNFNLGGSRARPFGPYSWTFFDTHEGKGAARRLVQAPPLSEQSASTDPDACFRAFLTLDEATRDHVRLIRDEFSDAWPWVLAGKPYDFGLALADNVGKLYHTSDRLEYAHAILQRFELLRGQMPHWSADA